MPRTRISTTVDPDLLARARAAAAGAPDSSLVDQALRALIAAHREATIDASYAIYDVHPLSEPDAWGDLESWRKAAAAS